MKSLIAALTTDVKTFDEPTWSEVEAAIAALDGVGHTSVILAPNAPLGPPDGGHHLGIGGGLDGRCIVYLTEDNLVFWNLEDASRSRTRRVVMVTGGQEGEFSDAQLVPREWALKAARQYFDSGTRAADLPWKKTE